MAENKDRKTVEVLPRVEISIEDIKAAAISKIRNERLSAITKEGIPLKIYSDILFPYLTTVQTVVHSPKIKISNSYISFIEPYFMDVYEIKGLTLPGDAPLKLSLIPEGGFIYAVPKRPKPAQSKRVITIKMLRICGILNEFNNISYEEIELAKSQWIPGNLKFDGKSIVDVVSAVYLPILNDNNLIAYPPFVLLFAQLEDNAVGIFAAIIDILEGSKPILFPIKIIENAEALYGYYKPDEDNPLSQVSGEIRFVYLDKRTNKVKSFKYKINSKLLRTLKDSLVAILGGGRKGKEKLENLVSEFETSLIVAANTLIKRCVAKGSNSYVISYGLCGEPSEIGEALSVSYLNPLSASIVEARKDKMIDAISSFTEPIYSTYILPMKNKHSTSHAFLPVIIRYENDDGMTITAYAINCKTFENRRFSVWNFKITREAAEEIKKTAKELLGFTPFNPPTVITAVNCEDYERLKSCHPNVILVYEPFNKAMLKSLLVVLTDESQFMVPMLGRISTVKAEYGEYITSIALKVMKQSKKGGITYDMIKIPIPIKPVPIEHKEKEKNA